MIFKSNKLIKFILKIFFKIKILNFRLNPTYADAVYNKGNVLAVMGRTDEAI
jgi:hypothetical protein